MIFICFHYLKQKKKIVAFHANTLEAEQASSQWCGQCFSLLLSLIR